MSMLVSMLLLVTISADDRSAQPDPVLTYQAVQDERAEVVVEDDLLVQRRPKSYLRWLYDALGFRSAVLLPLCGFIALVSAGRMVALSPQRKTMALDWIVLSLPLFVGLAGSIADVVYLWNLHSTLTPVRGPISVSEVLFSALDSTLTGLFCNLPAYFVAGIGLPLRRLLSRKDNRST